MEKHLLFLAAHFLGSGFPHRLLSCDFVPSSLVQSLKWEWSHETCASPHPKLDAEIGALFRWVEQSVRLRPGPRYFLKPCFVGTCIRCCRTQILSECSENAVIIPRPAGLLLSADIRRSKPERSLPAPSREILSVVFSLACFSGKKKTGMFQSLVIPGRCPGNRRLPFVVLDKQFCLFCVFCKARMDAGTEGWEEKQRAKQAEEGSWCLLPSGSCWWQYQVYLDVDVQRGQLGLLSKPQQIHPPRAAAQL